MPRVSVIVPAYNAANHLSRALDSALSQHYPDLEIIVADDASQDQTVDIARRYDDRVIVVRQPQNRGLAATRNLALEHASGELVALLDSDDAWLPQYLAEQVALYDRTRASIVCCDAFLERDGRRLPELYGDRFGRPDGEVTLQSLVTANPIFVSALLPRSAVDAAGAFDPSLRSVEDLDLWLRILELGGDVAYNPRPLAVYRLSATSLSTDVLRMTRSRQRVLRSAIARGRLNREALGAARRSLRLQEAAEQVELIKRDRGRPLRVAARLAVTGPLMARVAMERYICR